jgi:hypothetical protein
VSRRHWLGGMLAALGAAVTVLVVVGLVDPRRGDGRVLPVLLLVLLVVLLPFACSIPASVMRAASGGPDFFQPGTVLAVWYVVYIVVPAIHIIVNLDYVPNWSHPQVPNVPLVTAVLGLGVLGLVSFGIGYRLIPIRIADRGSAFLAQPAEVLGRRLLPVALAILSIGAVFKVMHVRALGGFTVELAANLSPGYREALGLSFGGIPYFLSMLFDAGAILLLFRAVTTRRGWLVALAVFVPALTLAYVMGGKRTAVVPFFLFAVLWYHYLHRRIGVLRGLAIVAFGGLVTSLLLVGRILAPVAIEGGLGAVGDVKEVAQSPGLFFLNSPELNEFDMMAVVIQERDALLRDAGGAVPGLVRYNLQSLTYLIPRAVWREKPVLEDIGNVVYRNVFPGGEAAGFGVGVVGVLYLFGGVAGVGLGMILVGALFRWLYGVCAPAGGRRPAVVFLYAVLFWSLFSFLRYGTFGFVFLDFIQAHLAVTLAILWVGRSAPIADVTVRGATA